MRTIKEQEETLYEFFQDNLVFDNHNHNYILGFNKCEESNLYKLENEDYALETMTFKTLSELLDYLEGNEVFKRTKSFNKARIINQSL